MNYRKHYEALMSRGKTARTGYLEKHHITPKCMGGTDESDNLVLLTPEEHFVAHQLLIKMFPENPKLVLAAYMMTCSPHANGSRMNNKLFGWLRQEMGRAISRMNKANAPSRCRKSGETQRGKKLSEDHRRKIGEAGKGRVASEETRNKIRQKALSRTPEQKRRRYEAATSPEAIEKYRAASANKVWMVDPRTKKTSFVSKELIETKLSEGWLRGRSI